MGYRHIWAEIDLSKIAENIRNLRSVAKSQRFMAVVKADGYGHGSVAVSKTAIENGADFLGVARINEAVKLRENGITTPILVLGYSDPCDTQKLLEYNLTQTVFSCETAEKYSNEALGQNQRLKVHIKVDTGMGRLGLVVNRNMECLEDIQKIYGLDGLETEGLYTHFASSDSIDRDYTISQIEFFKELIEGLEERAINIPIKHAANSAGIMEYEQAHFDMVRAGISMYGLYPSREIRKDIILKPAMEVKCRIAQVKRVPKDFYVSYGSTYKTGKETTLVTVPVGYADGFRRIFSSKGEMIVKGKKVQIAGRVCMDQTVLDVGDLDISPNDEVVIFGKQKNEEISVDDIADALSTINYEVVTTIMERVPRVYI